MSEIQHLRNTINHGISQCDDRIYTAQADAIDQIVDKAHTYTSSLNIESLHFETPFYKTKRVVITTTLFWVIDQVFLIF